MWVFIESLRIGNLLIFFSCNKQLYSRDNLSCSWQQYSINFIVLGLEFVSSNFIVFIVKTEVFSPLKNNKNRKRNGYLGRYQKK